MNAEGDAFVALLIAAMKDAADGNYAQLKATIDSGKGLKLVRIIVVPENMEHNWSPKSPLGSKGQHGG